MQVLETFRGSQKQLENLKILGIVKNLRKNHRKLHLRLWKSIPANKFDFSKFNSGDYYGMIESTQDAEMITSVLYPNDSTQNGRELRLKQQYFFVSATVQDIVRRFIRDNKDFSLLPDKVAIQLNDTHPSLTIIEMLRILVDIHNYEFATAWNLVTKTFSYTNHTILPEALEKWSVDLLQKLLPRHLELIYVVNFHFMEKTKTLYPNQWDKLSRLSLIEEGSNKQVRMANLCIHGSHCVNGVSKIHSEILQKSTFRDFYELDNSKFINVTNGVTPRRWIAEANRPLADLYKDTLGSEDYLIHLDEIKSLKNKIDDKTFLAKWKVIKQKAKLRLVEWVKTHYGIRLNESFLFDVMVKRIHEYKRQLMYCLHALHRYILIKKASKEEKQKFVPRAFILGGKAAPGYELAKKIIKFAFSVADLINNDKETASLLKFVF